MLSRREIVVSMASLAGSNVASEAFAQAGKITWNFGSSISASHPTNVRMREAADRIFKATDGYLEIRCFPDGALGGDTEMLSQVRLGAIQMMDMSALNLSTLVPLASLPDVGFAFGDYKDVWPAMDGGLGDVVRAGITSRGLHPFQKVFDNGFRQITTKSHPIQTPDDMRGLKLRVPTSPMLVSMFATLGASPTPLNFSEVYTSLQTGVVDGQENPLLILETSKLYEVQKYCAITRHAWDGHWIIANPSAYAKLPSRVQAVIDRELERAALDERADVQRMDESLQSQPSKHGLSFNVPDHAAMKAALLKGGFYKQWRSKFGEKPWRTLEQAVGPLE